MARKLMLAASFLFLPFGAAFAGEHCVTVLPACRDVHVSYEVHAPVYETHARVYVAPVPVIVHPAPVVARTVTTTTTVTTTRSVQFAR
jgi:hypothetical protein